MRTSTSEQILETAMQMAQTRGYNAFSYADISEVVGIRKASIHYHFPTKSSLGQALVRRFREDLVQKLQQIKEESSDPAIQLMGLARIFDDNLKDNSLSLSGILGANILTLPAPVREEVKIFFEEMETQVADILQAGCDGGAFAIGSPVRIEAQSLIANLHGAQIAARAAGWQSGQILEIMERFLASLRAK